jgi:hypothetical protein
MDKSVVLEAVMRQLQSTLNRQAAANQRASESATDEESRAETQWDTSGLESSYLARGYAQQAEATAKQWESLNRFTVKPMEGEPVGLGSLVLSASGQFEDWLFLLPCCGGLEVRVDENEVTIITPESPLAAEIMGKSAGDTYHTPVGAEGKLLRVL